MEGSSDFYRKTNYKSKHLDLIYLFAKNNSLNPNEFKFWQTSINKIDWHHVASNFVFSEDQFYRRIDELQSLSAKTLDEAEFILHTEINGKIYFVADYHVVTDAYGVYAKDLLTEDFNQCHIYKKRSDATSEASRILIGHRLNLKVDLVTDDLRFKFSKDLSGLDGLIANNEVYMEQDKTQQLLAAAKSVIERWDSPMWKHQEHTGKFIDELHKAVERFDEKTVNDLGEKL
jgi:hypothetical protein